jgi:hypothetical protein
MTDTIDEVAAAPQDERAVPALDEQGMAVSWWPRPGPGEGVELVDPSQLTKRVLETALEAEMSEHLGYDKCAEISPVGLRRRDPQDHLLQQRY